MTLYEINEKLRDFQFEIDEETGEILNADELDNLELSRNEKIENICLMIKNLKADAVAYKAEKDSFAAKEKAAKNNADRLLNYLQIMLNGETFKSTRATVSYRKSEILEVSDTAIIPRAYLKYSEPEVNKTALKKAVKEGLALDGVYIVEKQNLQLK